MPFLKAIKPHRIVKTFESSDDYYAANGVEKIEEPIDDYMSLRPQPKKPVLLIVGDATGVLEDIDRFLDFEVDFDTMCINYSVRLIPWKIQHFVAGDSHQPDMQAVAGSLKNGCIKHCWNPNSVNFDIRWIKQTSQGWNGTTANLAIRIGLILGYLRIVLAGVPMDNSGNWYQPIIPKNDVKQGKNHTAHLWKWTEIATRPIGRMIRSMSGNTADMFGKPTADWLNLNHKES